MSIGGVKKLADQSNGPKVEKVTKGGKGKSAKPGKAKAGEGAAVKVTKTHSKADAAKAAKEAKRAAAKEAKEIKKAARKEQKEAQKADKEKKKVASGQVKAAKKRIKDEKTEAVKIARENTGKKSGIKNKKVIIIIAAVILLLLIIGATIFLIRMIFGGKEEPNTPPPEEITSSSQAQLQGGTAGGSSASAGDQEGPASPTESSSQGDSSSSSSQKEDTESSSGEPSKNTTSSSTASQKETTGSPEGTDAVTSKELADQAVEGAAGTASVSALLGSGQGDPENMDIPQENVIKQSKPGQIVGGTTVGGQEDTSSSAASSEAPRRPEANPDHGTALTSPTQTQEVVDFKFSEESLHLPPFDYAAANGLEAAVHRDIENYLDEKDDRPGVQVSSVVIGGQYTLPDGTVRILAYAWGSRYAIADNTLFDYGNLVGPCALDYRGGALQNITLARSGDQFESSVREFCGDMTDIADRMLNHSYDLELRGQMIRNVSSYIRQNNIPVDFFRASGQVYNKDGSIYLPPDMQQSEETEESQESSIIDEATLQEDYRLIQDMPE